MRERRNVCEENLRWRKIHTRNCSLCIFYKIILIIYLAYKQSGHLFIIYFICESPRRIISKLSKKRTFSSCVTRAATETPRRIAFVVGEKTRETLATICRRDRRHRCMTRRVLLLFAAQKHSVAPRKCSLLS